MLFSGSFANVTGLSACFQCPGTTSTPSTGATSCRDPKCQAGFFCECSTCTVCPTCTICPSGTTVYPILFPLPLRVDYSQSATLFQLIRVHCIYRVFLAKPLIGFGLFCSSDRIELILIIFFFRPLFRCRGNGLLVLYRRLVFQRNRIVCVLELLGRVVYECIWYDMFLTVFMRREASTGL
jgi:hypothetical protein